MLLASDVACKLKSADEEGYITVVSKATIARERGKECVDLIDSQEELDIVAKLKAAQEMIQERVFAVDTIMKLRAGNEHGSTAMWP